MLHLSWVVSNNALQSEEMQSEAIDVGKFDRILARSTETLTIRSTAGHGAVHH
jgi:hypothetical protein